MEVGTASYSSNYVPIVGDELEVTSVTMAIRTSNTAEADKLITINRGDKVKLQEVNGDWYYVQYDTYTGWAPKECLKYDSASKSSGILY